jgi:hypothetical protein
MLDSATRHVTHDRLAQATKETAMIQNHPSAINSIAAQRQEAMRAQAEDHRRTAEAGVGIEPERILDGAAEASVSGARDILTRMRLMWAGFVHRFAFDSDR